MTPAQRRLRAVWKTLPPARQAEELRSGKVTAAQWYLWARDEQLTPQGLWTYWLILAGRGFGKTRTGAEWVREVARTSRYVNLIGATADDARDIMIEGESGILAVCPRRERPDYQPSKRRLVWPNGARSLIFTADEPERLRGKQHEKVWADELAAWRYAEAWEQTTMGLRLGDNPQACITTTPRPTKLVRELIADENTHVTRGSTYDNQQFLARKFFQTIIKKYEGTRLGRQELNAEMLDDNPGALWSRKVIDAARIATAPELTRIVVGVDPSVTSNEDSDECGIVVAGADRDDHFYVLDDASLIASPQGWARQVSISYHAHAADRAIAETNNGGDLVEAVLRQVDPDISYKKVTASRGKMIRAEPIAALYEQGRVHHVGSFAKLEDQMCDYNPLESTKSPDRMDAMVWALTELANAGSTGLMGYFRQQAEAKQHEREEAAKR